MTRALLKEERRRRILDVLERTGRIVAADLEAELGVSSYTIRRDLDDLAETGALLRVHGGALARSTTRTTYDERSAHQVPAKRAVARAAAALVQPGEVAILDSGSTALAVAEALPADHVGTVVTHSPPVAVALARLPGVEVVIVGGVLDRRTMSALGAQVAGRYGEIVADVCLLGIWSLHPERGITQHYPEEAELRRVLVGRADRVVGLATRDKLGTVAPFAVGPADALTHLVTEPDLPEALVGPYRELGMQVVT